MKISKQKALCVLICFLFFPPVFLSYFSSINTVLWITQLLIMGYILFVVCAGYRNLGIGSVVIVLYFGTFVLATILTQGNIYKALSAVLPKICFLLYTDYMLHKKPKLYINILAKFFTFYILINAMILLIFPQGIGKFLPGYDYQRVDSRMSWLGLDNGYIKYFLVAFVVFFIAFQNKKIKRNILYICMLATMIFVWSGTGIIGMGIMLAYIYFMNRGKINKIVNYWVCCGAGAILFLGIVLFRVTDRFSDFIVNFLGKDITFTGRTLLWDQAMLLISKSPIIGYGVYDYDLLISPANGQAYSAHNTILQMMLMGGLIVLITFIVIVLFTGWEIESIAYKKSDKFFKIKGVLCAAIFVMWICGITENMVFDIQLYLLFIMGMNIKQISTV